MLNEGKNIINKKSAYVTEEQKKEKAKEYRNREDVK